MNTSELSCEIKRYQRIDSTNRVALDLGSQGAVHGTVVLADEQSEGRGRQSRQFVSPHGGLYMSVILRPSLSVEKLSLITLAAGTSCSKAIEKDTSIRVNLKWPNDLYVKGKKVGGILVEAGPYSQSNGCIPFVVVGIGLNVNTRLEELPASLHGLVSSLYALTDQEYNIDKLIRSLVIELLADVFQLEKNHDKVLAFWQKHDYLFKKQISWVDLQGRVIHGTGNGLLEDGRYLLKTAGGDQYPVLAGDIIITEINGHIVK